MSYSNSNSVISTSHEWVSLEHSFSAMGSPCKIFLALAMTASAEQAKSYLRYLLNHALARIEQLESTYSRYRSDSLISRINAVADLGGSITVDAEMNLLLDYADHCHKISHGLFDITSGGLAKLWHSGRTTRPGNKEISSVLDTVGWHHVERNEASLAFLKPNMSIDMGGIVKEYAADEIAKLLQNGGISHGFVDLGGDIKTIGTQPNGESWLVRVKAPYVDSQDIEPQCVDSQQHTDEVHYLNDAGIATSGDYERYILIEGKRYSHLISPLTGEPVSSLRSVTVQSDCCMVAGSLATIAMLKGDAGIEWLTALDVEATIF